MSEIWEEIDVRYYEKVDRRGVMDVAVNLVRE